MALKGYVDWKAGREAVKLKMIEKHGADYVPPSGWDAFLGTDADLHMDQTCGQCKRLVPEIRPFGKDPYVGICEDCASKDMATYEQRLREHG